MKTLFLIPARKGSKGIPNKNRKKLAGKELLLYTLEAAREVADDKDICVSTDDEKLLELCTLKGLEVPFKRPANLAKDTTASSEVILHALDFYRRKKANYDCVVLLQPTSPFRTAKHIRAALRLYRASIDLLVSVCETKANPYTVLKEEDEKGFLKPSKTSKKEISRRQDAPKVYELNGAIYIINVASFMKNKSLHTLKKVKKYLMSYEDSIDLDEPLDWEIAEIMMQKKLVQL